MKANEMQIQNECVAAIFSQYPFSNYSNICRENYENEINKISSLALPDLQSSKKARAGMNDGVMHKRTN